MNATKFFTAVYEIPVDARLPDDICAHPYWSAGSWSDALADRDSARAQLAARDAEIADLRAQLAARSEPVEDAKQIGSTLANVAFNFAQKCGHTLTSDDCAIFKKLQVKWDEAISKQTIAQPAPSAQIGRDKLNEFFDKYCGNNSQLTACAESAFYWFNKCLAAQPAPDATLINDGTMPAPSIPDVQVKIDRHRIWIVKGVQSFMLAHEADTDEELEWYANQLRGALSIITPCVTQTAPKQSDGGAS